MIVEFRIPTAVMQMHLDRTLQFRDRLGWPVTVDQLGREVDQYDDQDARYVIALSDSGDHVGSMRFRSMAGRTMITDHFSHIADLSAFVGDPTLLECSRFCTAPTAPPNTGRRLMQAGADMMLRDGFVGYLGVFDAKMLPIYRRIGAPPEVLGMIDGIGVGLWRYTPDGHTRLRTKQ